MIMTFQLHTEHVQLVVFTILKRNTEEQYDVPILL